MGGAIDSAREKIMNYVMCSTRSPTVTIFQYEDVISQTVRPWVGTLIYLSYTITHIYSFQQVLSLCEPQLSTTTTTTIIPASTRIGGINSTINAVIE